MKEFLRTIVTTKDGSPSLFVPEINEHYHSLHGALTESLHVFIRMGLEKIKDSKFKIENSASSISILEIGFGTGLNAFLVAKSNERCDYVSIEAFPLKKEEWSGLNYVEGEEKILFDKLHEVEWNKKVEISENFALTKIETTLEEYFPAKESFDLVFFDAFSPDKQPELWTEDVFRKMFSAMKPGGILVTYCAKGQVRRNMIAAGFTVERAEGPPGKREMLRGFKIQ